MRVYLDNYEEDFDNLTKTINTIKDNLASYNYIVYKTLYVYKKLSAKTNEETLLKISSSIFDKILDTCTNKKYKCWKVEMNGKHGICCPVGHILIPNTDNPFVLLKTNDLEEYVKCSLSEFLDCNLNEECFSNF